MCLYSPGRTLAHTSLPNGAMASSRAGLRVFSLIAMSGGAFAYSSHGSDSLLPSVVEPNATALPTERGPLFAPMPDAVDPRWTTFKTAFEALDVESGGIVLSAENQQLLEKVLPRMIEFAGLIQEEKERILYMSSPAGRRMLSMLNGPLHITVVPRSHSCFGLDSLPPSGVSTAAPSGVSDMVVPDASIDFDMAVPDASIDFDVPDRPNIDDQGLLESIADLLDVTPDSVALSLRAPP